VVYRFMMQDWVLEEVTATDKYDQDEPGQLHATIIDSATSDTWHEGKAATVESKIDDALEKAEFTRNDRVLQFEGPRGQPYYITEEIPDMWTGKNLTSPPEVRELCRDQNMNSWWLKRGREPLSEVNRQGLHGGVQRRRSVGKAFFHIAEATGNSVMPATNSNDEVCIVAALGGGTGSGMMLDVASRLDTQRTHLFGILPHDQASGNEKTNALAALSELEYAHLAKEGPFDTMTLIPHLRQLETDDKDFEMAVVRTILAHQNGLVGGNLSSALPFGEDDPNTPPRFAPFSFAVPSTVKYDVGKRERAERKIKELLNSKSKELESESDFYEVVKKYLNEYFKETAGRVIKGDTNGTLDTSRLREEALLMRERIEDDIHNTLLEQEAFKIAGAGEEVEVLSQTFERYTNPDGDSLNIADDLTPMEEAVKFINQSPDMLWNALKDNEEHEYDPGDGIPYKLVNQLETEMRNIIDRRDLLEAISTIPDDDALDETYVDLVQKALVEAVLDSDTRHLTESIVNPTVEDEIEELIGSRNQLEESRDALEGLYEDTAESLVDDIQSWQEDAGVLEKAKTLANINKYETQIETAIEEFEEAISGRNGLTDTIEDAENVDALAGVTFDVGELNGYEIPGITPVNSHLEDMGIEKIPIEEIKTEFDTVIEARRHHLEHSSSIWPFTGEDREEEFNATLGAAADNEWFRINPDDMSPEIEDDFTCEFDAEGLSRSREVDEQKDSLIQEIVQKFHEQFTEDGQLPEYSLEYPVVGETSRTTELKLPQGTSITQVERALKDKLKALGPDTEEADAVLDNVLSDNPIGTDAPTAELQEEAPTTTGELFEGYLKPVAEERAEVEEELAALTGDDFRPGLIRRLDLLRGISSGETKQDEHELPKANEYDTADETYGVNFAMNYEAEYEIEIEYEGENIDSEKHPYLVRKPTEPEDVAGGAKHIGESNVLDNNEDEIVRSFKNNVADIFAGDPRAPINNLRLVGSGTDQEVDPAYDNLRFCPVYMSRAFDYDDDITSNKYQKVRDEFGDWTYLENSDIYRAGAYDSGGPDELTMVTFIGGVFLDNITPVTKNKGYMEVYKRHASTKEFIEAHHTIGLGGVWDRWRKMRQMGGEGPSRVEPNTGAIVYRDNFEKVNEEFIDELNKKHQGEGESTAIEWFLDNSLDVDTYESHINIDE